MAAAGIYIATKGHSKAKATNNVTTTSTNSTIENSESGIYNKLRNIILQKNKKAIETNSLNKYDNKKIIKKIEEILGE